MARESRGEIGALIRSHEVATVFAILVVAILLSHLSLLQLPYYWDEAGYYIPAAWDFLESGSLIPHSTLTNAHPPLPSVLLATAWKLFGFAPLVTRLVVVVVAALGLTGLWHLVVKVTRVRTIAAATVALTALYPVWFAQESLAHADIFAACGALWGLSLVLPRHNRHAALAFLCFSAAALSKETAIALPMSLCAGFFAEGIFEKQKRWQHMREAAWMAACALPLACWYGYHRMMTGFLFGNPEFLRYNAQANLSALRLLAAFGHRVLHLTAHMNLFVPVVAAFAALLLTPRAGRREIERPTLWCILWILGSNAFFYSILGGALLTRYLLPLFPLVLLLVVHTLWRRVRQWPLLVALSAAGFAIGLFVNPPYGFAPEDNLAYAGMIRLHQDAIAEVEKLNPQARVLTAWPLSDAMRKPELGYTTQSIAVTPIDDFSAPQITLAASEPASYNLAAVFSTKIDPPSPLFTLGPWSRSLDARYFGLHQDLDPAEVAARLGGKVIWQESRQGQWVALLTFKR